MNHGKAILGVTVYSYTNEYQKGELSFEQLVEKVGGFGPGTAIEMVGFQSIRGFPDVPDEFVRGFRNLVERYELIPACLGANVDYGRRRDRLMSMEEVIDYTERQMVSARKLGFPVLRIQTSAGPQAIEKMAPVAERLGIHIACELHSPMAFDHPEVVALKELYDRLGSPNLGFIPDFSTSMVAIPEVFWQRMRRNGIPEEALQELGRVWLSDKSGYEKFAAVQEIIARNQIEPRYAGSLLTSISMFGRMPVDGWKTLLPYARHIHGKFYEVDEQGREQAIPYPEIMALLKQEGYAGTISAEWEGHAFTAESLAGEQVERWMKMCRNLLADQ